MSQELTRSRLWRFLGCWRQCDRRCAATAAGPHPSRAPGARARTCESRAASRGGAPHRGSGPSLLDQPVVRHGGEHQQGARARARLAHAAPAVGRGAAGGGRSRSSSRSMSRNCRGQQTRATWTFRSMSLRSVAHVSLGSREWVAQG